MNEPRRTGFTAGEGKQAPRGPGESCGAQGTRSRREGGKLGEGQLRGVFRPLLTGSSAGAAGVWVIARKHR